MAETASCDLRIKWQGLPQRLILFEPNRVDEHWPSTTPPCWKSRPPVRYYNVPLLKSNLQKAIRRRNLLASIHTTVQLLKQGPAGIQALLRRLPIIVVEDVRLCPRFDELVWLMVAYSSGPLTYRLRPSDFQLVLEIVTALCQDAQAYEPEPLDRSQAGLALPVLKRQMWQDLQKRFAVRDAKCPELTALAVRFAFGGMPGDLRLLYRVYLDFAAHKFQVSPPRSCVLGKRAVNMALNDLLDNNRFVLRPGYQLAAAVDFHCTSIIADANLGAPENEQRQVMWDHRSGCNSRKVHTLKPASVRHQRWITIWDSLASRYWVRHAQTTRPRRSGFRKPTATVLSLLTSQSSRSETE